MSFRSKIRKYSKLKPGDIDELNDLYDECKRYSQSLDILHIDTLPLITDAKLDACHREELLLNKEKFKEVTEKRKRKPTFYDNVHNKLEKQNITGDINETKGKDEILNISNDSTDVTGYTSNNEGSQGGKDIEILTATSRDIMVNDNVHKSFIDEVSNTKSGNIGINNDDVDISDEIVKDIATVSAVAILDVDESDILSGTKLSHEENREKNEESTIDYAIINSSKWFGYIPKIGQIELDEQKANGLVVPKLKQSWDPFYSSSSNESLSNSSASGKNESKSSSTITRADKIYTAINKLEPATREELTTCSTNTEDKDAVKPDKEHKEFRSSEPTYEKIDILKDDSQGNNKANEPTNFKSSLIAIDSNFGGFITRQPNPILTPLTKLQRLSFQRKKRRNSRTIGSKDDFNAYQQFNRYSVDSKNNWTVTPVFHPFWYECMTLLEKRRKTKSFCFDENVTIENVTPRNSMILTASINTSQRPDYYSKVDNMLSIFKYYW